MDRLTLISFSCQIVTVNCARLIKTDQHATNGIVHVVDRVITAISNNVHSFIDTDDDLETLRVSVEPSMNTDQSIPHQSGQRVKLLPPLFRKGWRIAADMRAPPYTGTHSYSHRQTSLRHLY